MQDLRTTIQGLIYAPEKQVVEHLLPIAQLTPTQKAEVKQQSVDFVALVRNTPLGNVDALMNEYDLSTKEGITLMCVAESLLRIPDTETQDALIKDKIGGQSWQHHLGKNKSAFVNASTWGLLLTGKWVSPSQADLQSSIWTILKGLSHRLGDPVIRKCIRQGMHIMGRQFVIGETIKNAYTKATSNAKLGYTHSFDMLGEGARTDADAITYMESYENALHTVGKKNTGKDLLKSDGISVKLSALHARYSYTHLETVLNALYPRLLKLATIACEYNVGLFIDAEEAERLDISMTILEKLIAEPVLKGWQGLGIVIQAYQKRAYPYIDWVAKLSQKYHKRLMVRLVKGAYWDTEIKRSQTLNTGDFPVFTRKQYTDVSYMACIKKLFTYNDVMYPCFATHNAHTVATVMTLGKGKQFEFQCLHGMGGVLQDTLLKMGYAVRIYAPVGGYKNLLAYLVRRLLENGANSNFINRITNLSVPIDEITEDPVDISNRYGGHSHPAIQMPSDICGDNRINAKGIDITQNPMVDTLVQDIQNISLPKTVTSIIGGKDIITDNTADDIQPSTNHIISTVHLVGAEHIETALHISAQAFKDWKNTDVNTRADILLKTADVLEQNTIKILAVLQVEAGKTLDDAVAEIREAVDFLRYYADQGRSTLVPHVLPGPTGETNMLYRLGQGTFVCISPWNFPLAIFMGQIAAALVTGNCVIAKPADSTPLIAHFAIDILHQAGIPTDVLHLVLTDGATLGKAAFAHKSLGGVCFTGSMAVANSIQKQLANRLYGIVPFIAETGGQNALIADSSALLEQLCDDIIMGAFASAGQRCSALRVLYVQSDIADAVIDMIQGAMQQLHIGDNMKLSTDVGPIITQTALDTLNNHKQWLRINATVHYENPMPIGVQGTFCTPMMAEIEYIGMLEQEVFGPILHVIRYNAKDLDTVINHINGTGYGLTLGIHSRIDATIEYIVQAVNVGNVYVNRNQIGAVVGTQPFGGMGLSGTGPKAGGPLYLTRFVTEKTISNNITAAGGNAHLMIEIG